MKQIILSWSGGKDSAMTLNALKASKDYEVVGLLTAFSGDDQLVNLHYTPYQLIKAQADAMGIPLHPIYLSANAANKEYEAKHEAKLRELKMEGIEHVAFGDIHLAPIREYRDQLMESIGVIPVYPLWHQPPSELMQNFLDQGHKAIVTAIDSLMLGVQFLGQTLSHEFINQLPPEVDSCGENGEFHSFLYDGPLFRYPLNVECQSTFENDLRPQIEMKLKACQLKLL